MTIGSINILIPPSPSSALLPYSLSGAESRINGVMGGGKQVMMAAKAETTEQGNSLHLPPLPSLNECISPCRASSPGRHLTSASPSYSSPSLQSVQGFSHTQITKFLGFIGFSRHSCNPLPQIKFCFIHPSNSFLPGSITQRFSSSFTYLLWMMSFLQKEMKFTCGNAQCLRDR